MLLDTFHNTSLKIELYGLRKTPPLPVLVLFFNRKKETKTASVTGLYLSTPYFKTRCDL